MFYNHRGKEYLEAREGRLTSDDQKAGRESSVRISLNPDHYSKADHAEVSQMLAIELLKPPKEYQIPSCHVREQGGGLYNYLLFELEKLVVAKITA